MKWFIIVVFCLGVCWGASRLINIGGTVFAIAGMPVSWGMLIFFGGFVLVASRVK